MTSRSDQRCEVSNGAQLWKIAILIAVVTTTACSRSTSGPVSSGAATASLFEARAAQDVRSAIAAGARIDATRPYKRASTGDTEQTTALWVAARWGRTAVVRELIAAGSEVDATAAPSRDSPLWIAAREGHLATVQVLLQSGATVDHPNKGGVTPLQAAIVNGDVGVIKELLDAGANPNRSADDGLPPLLLPILRAKQGVHSFLRRSPGEAAPFSETRPLLELLWAAGARADRIKTPSFAGYPLFGEAMVLVLVVEVGTKEEFRWLYERGALKVNDIERQLMESAGRSAWLDDAKPSPTR